MSMKYVLGVVVVGLGVALVYQAVNRPAAPPAPVMPGPNDEVLEAGTTAADVAKAIISAGRGRRDEAIAEYAGVWLPPEGWTGVVDLNNDILGSPTVNMVDPGITGGLTVAGKLADPEAPLPPKGAKIVMRGRIMTYRVTPIGARLDLDSVTFMIQK